MKIRFATFTAVAVFMCVPSIHAALNQELMLTQPGVGGGSITIDQTGAIIASSGAFSVTNITVNGVGSIAFSGTIGTFTIRSASATGFADTIMPGLQDQVTLDTSSSGVGTLDVQYSDKTYTGLGPNFLLSGSESTANTSATTVLFTATGDAGGAIPGLTPVGALVTLSGVASGTSAVVPNTIGVSGTLTSTAHIVFAGAGTFNTTFDIAEYVPEPTSVLLLGSLLLGVAGITRRKVAKRL